jgi:hypothetical protein
VPGTRVVVPLEAQPQREVGLWMEALLGGVGPDSSVLTSLSPPNTWNQEGLLLDRVQAHRLFPIEMWQPAMDWEKKNQNRIPNLIKLTPKPIWPKYRFSVSYSVPSSYKPIYSPILLLHYSVGPNIPTIYIWFRHSVRSPHCADASTCYFRTVVVYHINVGRRCVEFVQ